ncbi:MAG: hypothetical protein ACFFD6_09210 [Candidatus Thorarchaeota archaeon]
MSGFVFGVDEIVRREVEAVRVRRIILDQLEGGAKTGRELRDSIVKDMKAQLALKGKRVPKKLDITSPKLYHNTQHLEKIGIITSTKLAQNRLFELSPMFVHPVRRALGLSRPLMYVTALSNPENQRPLVQWLSKNPFYNPSKLLVFVEASQWTRGVSRILDRFIPDDAFRRWSTEWVEVEDELTGEGEPMVNGNLQGVYEKVGKELLDRITEHDIVIDLTMGPQLLVLAMSWLAHDYSIAAIHVSHYGESGAQISYSLRGV